MQEDIRDVINRFKDYCARTSRLVIYGAGDVGRMVAEFMDEEDISFDYFCVTEKSGKNAFCNHEIRTIEEVISDAPETGIIVAVSKKNVEEILCLLENQTVYYYYSTEFLFRLFERKCERAASKVLIRDGYIYEISGVAFDRNTMYICCPASIGDTLYIAALVKAYKREHPYVSKVCMVLKKGHGELGRLFPAVDEVLVSDEIVQILDFYSLYTQTWTLKNYVYGHFKKSSRFIYDPEYNQKDCRNILTRYSRLVMNLSTEAELEKIHLGSALRYAEKSNEDIVLMPYARTAKLLPFAFWETLARRLTEKGYTVYTNIGGEKERAIQGTIPVKKTLLDMALLCEGYKAVISLRSGLCDLLGFTETRLIVVNTSEELYEEWNLEDVFDRKDIYNINCFDGSNHDKEIDQIMEIIG